MARELRPYQAEAVEAIREAWASGITRTATVLATGLGKTDILARVATDAAREGKRVLILAHRSELLDQITERCGMHDDTIPVGRVQGARSNTRRLITVAMEPTLRGDKRRAKMLPPDVVIVDECHHAASPGYVKILQWAGCFEALPGRAAPTPLLGVTATMTRGDKRGLGDVFESVCYERGILFGIEQGYLVRPHGRVVVASHMDLSRAKVSRGDFQDGELDDMVVQDVDEIVKAWWNYASDRPTVAFTPGVDSAKALAKEFRRSGVPTGEVYGSTPHAERQQVYQALGRGELRVLVNVMVATEGFDLPALSCVLMARPTKLRGLYQQAVGRGLRLSPETGKSDCLVLDVVGASRTQTLATLVDLLPGAQVDTTEIDLVPCSDCGGFLGRRPQVVRMAVERGMSPCACLCDECRLPRESECQCNAVERDPDGGRRRLIGPAQYEDLDLLGLSRAETEFNWLTTPGGTPFLSANVEVLVDGRAQSVQRLGSIFEDADGTWSAGTVTAWGPKDPELLAEGVAREVARKAVETWAETIGATYKRTASWRRKRESPSPGQVRAALRLGIVDPEQYTKGALSDQIDIERARRRFDVVVASAGPVAVRRVELDLDAEPEQVDEPGGEPAAEPESLGLRRTPDLRRMVARS